MEQRALKIALVAGEASGDLLGAGLLGSLKSLSSQPVQAYGIAGPKMIAQGCQVWYPMESLSVMGLVEVLKHYRRLSRLRAELIARLLADPPDVFIGIDAPDFTLYIEKRLRQAGIKTVHYVSPSVWAWRQKRIFTIKDSVDLMLTLFPFEVPIYQTHGIPAVCVGHTLADQLPLSVDVGRSKQSLGYDSQATVGVLMPGSRNSEVHQLAEVFLETAFQYHQHQPAAFFCMPLTREAHIDFVQRLLQRYPPSFQQVVRLSLGDSHTVMAAADWILIASGTATLEALLLKKPMVVAYKVHWLSYLIFKRLIKVPWVSLPNLLAQKTLVPECLQHLATPEKLLEQIHLWEADAARLESFKQTALSLHLSVRKEANARAAQAVLEVIRGSN